MKKDNGTIVGTIQLRYSPSCKSAWAKITFNSALPSGYTGNAFIHQYNSDHMVVIVLEEMEKYFPDKHHVIPPWLMIQWDIMRKQKDIDQQARILLKLMVLLDTINRENGIHFDNKKISRRGL